MKNDEYEKKCEPSPGDSFHDMMHKEIEVYIDDMIVKYESEEQHLVNLKKLFERLRKYKLRLNPSKCTFG